VRHKAIGLNFIDTYQRTGLYQLPLPFVGGNEAAGEVTQVGSGVTDMKVGDRVTYQGSVGAYADRSGEHTSELQSRENPVCRLPPPPPHVPVRALHDALPLWSGTRRSASTS